MKRNFALSPTSTTTNLSAGSEVSATEATPCSYFPSPISSKQFYKTKRGRANTPRRESLTPKRFFFVVPITGPNIYREFPTQAQAFQYAETKRGCHIFARETDHDGKRRFIVASYDEFWRRYSNISSSKHYYEVIREGAACHLYFDIEFSKAANAASDGEKMMQIFKKQLGSFLFRCYRITYRDDTTIELDSTTDKKFSRHLIMHLKDGCAVFQNNIDMGEFVRQFVLFLKQQLAQQPEIQELYVDDGKGNMHPFLDPSVYSRNRCFRLPFSSKFGRDVPLLPIHENGLLPSQRVFRESLICNIELGDALRILSAPNTSGTLTNSFGQKIQQQQQQQQQQKYQSQYVHQLNSVEQYCLDVWNHRASQGLADKTGSLGWGVQQHSTHTANGKVRTKTWLVASNHIILNLANNRWCDNIGRAHKSNGVYLIVDMHQHCFHQRCFDVNCNGFRSSDFLIPSQLFETRITNSSNSGEEEDKNNENTTDVDDPKSSQGWTREVNVEDWDDNTRKQLDHLLANMTPLKRTSNEGNGVEQEMYDVFDESLLSEIDRIVGVASKKKHHTDDGDQSNNNDSLFLDDETLKTLDEIEAQYHNEVLLEDTVDENLLLEIDKMEAEAINKQQQSQ